MKSWDLVRHLGLGAEGSALALSVLFRVTVLLLVAMLAALVLRKTSAAVRHLVWTLALTGSLLIPVFSWAFPAWQWAVLPRDDAPAKPIAGIAGVLPAQHAAAGDLPIAAVESRRIDAWDTADASVLASPGFGEALSADRGRFDAASNQAVPAGRGDANPVAPLQNASAVSAKYSWGVLGAVLWGVGALGGLVSLGVGIGGAWRLSWLALPAAESPWRRLLRQLMAACGLRRAVDVRWCPRVSVPMTWGFRRPVILLPNDGDTWSEATQRSVLLHELGHIRRGDCVVHLLGRLACAVYWFHPLVWLAARQLRKASEQAADDVVLASNVAPPDYAEQLVRIAAQATGVNVFGHVALPMASPSDLEGRVLAILDTRRDRRSLKRMTCAGLALLATLLLIPWAVLRLGYAENEKAVTMAANAAEQNVTASATANASDDAMPSVSSEGAEEEKGSSTSVPLSSRPEGLQYRVSGQVTGPDGKPVEGATVHPGEFSGLLPAKTDAEGRFQVTVLSGDFCRMAVLAEGYAVEGVTIPPGEEAKPVLVHLQPPATLRVRVVDRDGKPIAGAHASVGNWQEFRIPSVSLNTDVEGRFVWKEAPRGEILFTITAPDCVWGCPRLTASDQEQTITLLRDSISHVTAVDADTNQPIDMVHARAFWQRIDQDRFEQWPPMNWHTMVGKNGKLDVRPFPSMETIKKGRLVLAAKGYAPLLSPEWSLSDGDQEITVKLKKSQGPAGVVLTPDGKPAVDAAVAFQDGGSDSPWVELLEFAFRPRRMIKYEKTDAEGQFQVRTEAVFDGFGTICVAAPSGYGQATWLELEKTHTIQLRPWGRLEGTIRDGRQPMRNTRVMLNVLPEPLSDFDAFSARARVYGTTDDNGRIVIEHAPPGKAEGRILLPAECQNSTLDGYSRLFIQTVAAGETTHIEIGGDGRRVLGRIDTDGLAIDWPENELGGIHLHSSTQSRELQDTFRRQFTVRPDGSFAINDVLPGDYRLWLDIQKRPKYGVKTSRARLPQPPEKGAATAAPDPVLEHEEKGRLICRFTIPEKSKGGGDADRSLDLGTLHATMGRNLKLGEPAPDFNIETLDGKSFSLHEQKGKLVLLHFGDREYDDDARFRRSTQRDAAPRQSLVNMMRLHKRFADDPRFAMLGLAVGVSRKENAVKRIQTLEIAWAVAIPSSRMDLGILRDYGVRHVPMFFLIGPDGKILATDLLGKELEAAVEKSLSSMASPSPEEKRDSAAKSGRSSSHSGGVALSDRAGATAGSASREIPAEAEETVAVTVAVETPEAKNAAASSASPAEKLAEVIAKVRENEALLQNIDYVIHTTRKLGRGDSRIETTGHTVTTGPKLYYSGKEIVTTQLGEGKAIARLTVCDGTETVSIEEGVCVTIQEGRYEPPQVIPPHSWGLFHQDISVPLSVYLQGTDALRSHPKVRRYPLQRDATIRHDAVTPQWVGEETIDGLDCVRIHIEWWDLDRQPRSNQDLWLAKDRNYHVAQFVTSYIEKNGRDFGREGSRVTKWRELAAGIWIPEVVEWKNAWPGLTEEQRERNLRRLTVEEATLNPNVPESLFQPPKIPKDLPRYKISSDGRMIDSPHHPTPVAADPGTTVDKILTRLAEEEKRYDSMDIAMTTSYRLLDVVDYWQRFPLNRDDCWKSTLRQRSVFAGERLYYEEKLEKTRGDGATLSTSSQRAYDGRWLRQRNEGDQASHTANMTKLAMGQRDNVRAVGPHTLLCHADFRAGDNRLSSFFTPADNSYRRWRAEYCGDEQIDDLCCYKIKYMSLAPGESSSSSYSFLWLARDRNLLPVRREHRLSPWSDELPMSLSYVEDLREVRPGQWLPYRATELVHQTFHGAGIALNRLLVESRRDTQVDEVAFDSPANDSLFTNIECPKGFPINVEDKQGTSIGQFVQPETGGIQMTMEAFQSMWHAAAAKEEEDKDDPRDTSAPERGRIEAALKILRADPPAAEEDRIEASLQILRTYRPFQTSEKKGALAIRSLIEIGKPATAKLMEELDNPRNPFDRQLEVRGIGFALRGIGDSRAVPALIRAIPRSLESASSNYFVLLRFDDDLRSFMRQHDYTNGAHPNGFMLGRPVNEIVTALQRLTKVQSIVPTPNAERDFGEINKLVQSVLPLPLEKEKTVEQKLALQFARQWADWWSQHWKSYVSDESEAQLGQTQEVLDRLAKTLAESAAYEASRSASGSRVPSDKTATESKDNAPQAVFRVK